MSKSTWEMVVPVISTGHAPHANFIEDLNKSVSGAFVEGSIVVDISGGALVFLGAFHEVFYDPPEWFVPILEWMNKEYEGSSWLRFSDLADEIEELPTYEW